MLFIYSHDRMEHGDAYGNGLTSIITTHILSDFTTTRVQFMNVDKAKKRIDKLVKRGFKGYPVVGFEYFGETTDVASEVVVTFISEENAAPQAQKFLSKTDAREDESIQSVLVKTIERTDANTVTLVDGVSIIK